MVILPFSLKVIPGKSLRNLSIRTFAAAFLAVSSMASPIRPAIQRETL